MPFLPKDAITYVFRLYFAQSPVLTYKQPPRPLIFVAHGLGGILVKDVCFIHLFSQFIPIASTQALLRSVPIYKATYGIIFMSVPNQGSDWAKNMSALAFGSQPIRSLDVDKQALEHLWANFLAALKEDTLKIHTFNEAESMPGRGEKV
jgi:hypothetical protein